MKQKFVEGEGFAYSPRVFAENFIMEKVFENEPRFLTRSGRMIFKQGDDSVVMAQADRYPIVSNVVPSQATANALKNLLYGQDGVLTAHLSYLYQSWINSPQDKVFGDYLAKLAQNDGEILNALGNIVVAFGGDPSFMTSNSRNWTTQNLILTRNRDIFLRHAINMERNAIKNLENTINIVENESLKTLLSSIREDKEKIVVDLGSFLNQ